MGFGIGRKGVWEGGSGRLFPPTGGGGGRCPRCSLSTFLWRLLLWYGGVDWIPGLWLLFGEVLGPRYEGWVGMYGRYL